MSESKCRYCGSDHPGDGVFLACCYGHRADNLMGRLAEATDEIERLQAVVKAQAVLLTAAQGSYEISEHEVKQLREKVTRLRETQEKLAIAEDTINRLRGRLRLQGESDD